MKLHRLATELDESCGLALDRRLDVGSHLGSGSHLRVRGSVNEMEQKR